MPCGGNYEAMAKDMGFDCSQFSDEDKTAMSEEIDALVAAGMSEENAIRYVASRGQNPEVTMGGAVPTPDPLTEWPNERMDACRSWGDARICFKMGTADEPQEITIGGFRGVLDPANGQLHVYDVPLFVACKRGKKDFNEDWMDAALSDAKRGEADGYFPPMHVLHHGRDSEDVISAGVFRMTRIDEAVFKEEIRTTLFGTLIFTNPKVIGEFMANRLPYRSIEVMDFSQKKIDSLALLDHEPPFLELPMTANMGVGEGFTFSVTPAGSTDPVVAYFSRGSQSLIVQENPMVSDYTPIEFKKDEAEGAPEAESPEGGPPASTPDEDGGPEAASMEMGESPPAGDAEVAAVAVDTDPAAMAPDGAPAGPDTSWMEEDEGAAPGPVNTESVVTAILEGTIAVKDFHAIQQAIAQVESAAHPEGEEKMEAEPEMEEEAYDKKAPPAAAPGEAMKREVTPEEAALMGRVEALEADKAVRQDDAAVKSDVDAALELLSSRSLGEDPRGRYMEFRRTHGKAAFDAYVGELAKELPPKDFGTRFGQGDPASFDFGRRTPDEVMAYQKDGAEVFARAQQLAGEWDAAKKGGVTSQSLERYLEINVNGLNALI